MAEAGALLTALQGALRAIGPPAVAVSGGVDSMTLAVVAGRLGLSAQMFHARSPAVPPDASARVQDYAAREGWNLYLVDAGEFTDARYLANPANRCFFCKTNLYDALAQLTDRVLVAGTNQDDLGDYRPGLAAAAAHGVRHPYLDADIDKAGVRALAHYLGLNDLAELPAAPCLSSRIETGIRIDADVLRAVDAAEKLLRAELSAATVRCRVRATSIGIELDQTTLERLSLADQHAWSARIAQLFQPLGVDQPVAFQPYRMGSAFLHPRRGA